MSRNSITIKKYVFSSSLILLLTHYGGLCSNWGSGNLSNFVSDYSNTSECIAMENNDAIQIFYASEKHGIIGVNSDTDKENIKDNFFTVMLPDNFSPSAYDIVLKYELFGLDGANQTTKIINGALAYGGQSIQTTSTWSQVEEYIDPTKLRAGTNEIFFTRRADENYRYEIKNLSINLIEKRIHGVSLAEKDLKSYNGTVHLLGYAPKDIVKVEVMGEMISICNGVFEHLLENVPKSKDELELVYSSSEGVKIHQVYPVSFYPEVLDKQFHPRSNSRNVEAYSLKEKRQVTYYGLKLNMSDEKSAQNILLQGLEYMDVVSPNSEVAVVTEGNYLAYRITADEKNGSASMKVHLEYDLAKIPDGYGPKDVRTFAYDRIKREWKVLPVDSLDYENNAIITNFNGNTDYINGVIKVPEMPESSSFTPTMITDMEYANPSAGVVSIAPPSANSNGAASTSFPIKLPKGRNGMMPSLSVNYNSEGGNSWMGMGWNLQLPAITLDTRWGVPRFEGAHETEIYQLNGEGLVMNVNGEYTAPHRSVAPIGRVSNRIFYLRKEGGFHKIIRHGNNPSNYYWEVVDKLGNKSFYGGVNSVVDGAVVKNLAGNITHWALYETRDPHGNYVRYGYDKNIVTLNNGIQAQSFYPAWIEYTLHASSSSSNYRVDFNRSNDPNIREDIFSDARTGTLMITNDVLTEIKISFMSGQAETIRTYRFEYDDNIAFKKMHLLKISEYDSADNLFYSNTMEYYDMDGSTMIDNSTVHWDGADDQIGSTLLDIATGGVSTLLPDGSALGTGTYSGFSAGLRIGMGVGLNPLSVILTAGGSYNYNQSKEKSRISFLDINGDGLPDKVYTSSSGGLKYLPNLGIDSNGQGNFGDPKNVLNIGNTLDETKSRTNGFGWDANAVVIGVGKSKSKTRTDTDGYFTDFNGDGLPDIVSNGRIKFNRTTPWHGSAPNISFGNDADYTQNPIFAGQIDESVVDDLELQSLDQLRADHSQFDHVTTWRAPYSGTIEISGDAFLRAKNNCDNNGATNEFRLRIEKAVAGSNSNAQIIINSTKIFNTIDQPQSYNTPPVIVNKGDLLFFRIHNTNYGCGGEVEWNPTINYSSVANIPNEIDENGKSLRDFNPKDDFIMNNGGTWSPEEGVNSIGIDFNVDSSMFSTYQFSDDIIFKVDRIRTDFNPDGTVDGVPTVDNTWTRKYLADGGFTGSNSIPSINVNTNGGSVRYAFRFYAESTSNVQWDDINWRPEITAGADISFPPVNLNIYDNNVNETKYWIDASQFDAPIIDSQIPNDGETPFIRISHPMFVPDIYENFINTTSFENEEFPIKINWVVKEKTNGVAKTLMRKSFYLYRLGCSIFICNYEYRDSNNNIISPSNTDYFQFNLTKDNVTALKSGGGKVYSAFYVDNTKFGKNNSANITFELHPNEATNPNYNFVPTVLDSPFFSQDHTFLGVTHRGWTQFLYNGGLKYDYNEEGEITNPNNPDVFEDEIEMDIFDFDADPQDVQDEIENADPETADMNETVARYTFYDQNNEANHYINHAIFNRIEVSPNGAQEPVAITYGYNTSNELTSTLGRFGEFNLYDLWIDPDDLISNNTSTFIGLKQRTESKGKAKSFNGGVPPLNYTGTFSEANSRVLNQYLDLNGDRYPDLVTNGSIQFTNMLGGLMEHSIGNSFVAGTSNSDNSYGVNIAGIFPNSTDSNFNNNSGINTGDGKSFNSRQWADINGDGLVDKVSIMIDPGRVLVELNTGYGFSEEIVWGSGYSDFELSNRTNTGIGGSIGNASFAFGFGGGENTSNLNVMLLDVNGDGLVDLIKKTGFIYTFYLNTGTRFENTAYQTFYNGEIDESYSISGNIFGSATYGFIVPIPFAPLKFTFTGTAGFNAGINEKRITVQDINGDGLPDILEKGSDNGDIKARLNKVGRTHKLKSVKNPLGGSWSVEYSREGNTFELPQNKWVLSKVATHDGFTGDEDFGPNETLTTFSYENPRYDRREREFLGFGRVQKNQAHPSNGSPYRYTVEEYHNENVYLNGALKTSRLEQENEVLNQTSTVYNIMSPESPQTNPFLTEETDYLQIGLDADLLDRSRLFVAPVKKVTTNFENGESLSLEERFSKYDSKGNLTEYINFGDTYTSSASQDAYRTEIKYFNNIPNVDNSTGFVEKVQVFRNSDGQLLRQREAEYTLDKIDKIKTKLNDTEVNETSLMYDNYGNITKATLANGFETIIAYDNMLDTYPVSITNSFGETSSSQYNYHFGIPILVTDMNGQQIRTRIDNRGRPIEVSAPKEMPYGWTLRMQYQGEAAVPQIFNGSNYVVSASGSFEASNPPSIPETGAKHHAVTRHNVTFGSYPQTEQLLTVSLVDGFGKAIQLKKTLYANANASSPLRWMINGKEKQDAFGRVTHAYLPSTQTGYPSDPDNLPPSAFNYITGLNSTALTLMEYDAKDRVVSTTQPGENQAATMEYGIEEGMFKTTAINELGQRMEIFTDTRGRQRKTVQNGELTTEFYYNTVGEKIKVKNQQGYETFYKYDIAGRRTEERHPDRGLSTYEYDLVGNLIKRATSNLLSDGQQQFIAYQYDFNRLTKINYPLNPENDVQYFYGTPGTQQAVQANAVGRLFMQRDASGVQGFRYDEMGNLATHLRGIAVAGRHPFWYATEWKYDSHNRIHKITYPDDEEVRYIYNDGGTLASVERDIPSVVTDNEIVRSIEYNNLGERAAIYYGNGSTTTYTYDTRRRLRELGHGFYNFNITNQYSYDPLNNIEEVATLNPGSSIPGDGQLGGPIRHEYTYDDYNRLVTAKGRYTGPNDLTTPLLAQEYTLDMEYDIAHNIVKKTQTHIQGVVNGVGGSITDPETMVKNNYHLEYNEYASGAQVAQGAGGTYGYVQPHAPREIIETPDNSGLPNTDPNHKKKLIEYDANGNQTKIKQVVFEGAQPSAYEGIADPEEITLRRYLWDEENRLRAADMNPDKDTAHPVAVYTYDVEGQRVVRYIPGRVDVNSNAINSLNIERDEVLMYPSPLITAKAMTDPGNVPSKEETITTYTKHYYIGNQRFHSTLGTARNLGLFPEKFMGVFPLSLQTMANNSVHDANTGLLETYNELEQPLALQSPVTAPSISGFQHDPKKYDAYWYHGDHLGSSSYISTFRAKVTQHMEYLPFGELLVDEHLNSYNTPFKFNAKELDEETGNYYMSARYYNPKWSTWLSVDPLAEMMPTFSSYAYAFNNPIVYTDPTGMAPESGWPPTWLRKTFNKIFFPNRSQLPDGRLEATATQAGYSRATGEYINPNEKSNSETRQSVNSVSTLLAHTISPVQTNIEASTLNSQIVSTNSTSDKIRKKIEIGGVEIPTDPGIHEATFSFSTIGSTSVNNFGVPTGRNNTLNPLSISQKENLNAVAQYLILNPKATVRFIYPIDTKSHPSFQSALNGLYDSSFTQITNYLIKQGVLNPNRRILRSVGDQIDVIINNPEQN